jgi:hypothetical protein
MGQPDLDFTAPEVQTASNCSPMSDMFSLGLLIASLYNNGRSLVEANLSTSNYCKQLEAVSHIIFLTSMLFLDICSAGNTITLFFYQFSFKRSSQKTIFFQLV